MNRQRALIALVEVLGLSVWFAAAAVAPSLSAQWHISTAAAAWLTISVQIGFVAGAVASAVGNLADRYAPHKLLALSALGAAVCTATLTLLSADLVMAVALRLLAGVFLAGVYPVGMKLIASWSEPSDRGHWFGILLGALTVGSALPHLIAGLGPLPWRGALLAAAGLAVAAAVVAIVLIRPGPHVDVRTVQHNPRKAFSVFANRGPRLVMFGYLGHMWELYALWTWLAVFVLTGRQQIGDRSPTGLIAFVSIGIAGAFGCVVAGRASDRLGRRSVATVALVVSGSCCVASPFFFTAPTAVLVGFLTVWGAAAIADSAAFSTALSETTDPRFVGTTLTAQTAAGFLLTVVTIQIVPLLAHLTGWQYAFLILAPGPLLGAVAMSALTNLTKETPLDYHPRAPRAVGRTGRATLADSPAR
jgi:MFS family permease